MPEAIAANQSRIEVPAAHLDFVLVVVTMQPFGGR
jgi:hypothetical protein